MSKLKRAGFPSLRRLAHASSMAPIAPMAPPSVGVATPMKIVPSTRKISSSGGTMTNTTCSASADRRRGPLARLTAQLMAAATMARATASAIVKMTKSAAR